MYPPNHKSEIRVRAHRIRKKSKQKKERKTSEILLAENRDRKKGESGKPLSSLHHRPKSIKRSINPKSREVNREIDKNKEFEICKS